jgi:hypothetical protein
LGRVPEDGHLRLFDDGGRKDTAEAAEIGDGERSALHLIGFELARTGARGQVLDFRCNPTMFFSSELRITGTIRPFSSATAFTCR